MGNLLFPTGERFFNDSLRNALPEVDRLDPAAAPRRRPETAPDAELVRLRAELRSHPCHGCAEREDHARWADRHRRLRADTDSLVRRIEGRTNTIARVFDRVCDLLVERGYLAEVPDPDGDTELTAGDFVRWCRQVIDLLGQIASAAGDSGDERLRATALRAVDGVRRGVVASS